MHFSLNWLGPASSIATVIALIVTLLYYLYKWPFHLKKPENLTAEYMSGQVRLRWNLVQRASNYNIYRIHLKSGVMDIFSCAVHFYNDMAVVAGETYEYHVIADDQGHESPQPDVKTIVVTVGPVPPAKDDDRKSLQNIDPDLPETQWPVADLHRVYAELQKIDNKTVLAILEMSASQPDTLVSFSDVCERAGVTRPKGGGGIGSFTMLIRRLGKTRWLFTIHQGQGGPFYKLSAEMAERWRQAEAAGTQQ